MNSALLVCCGSKDASRGIKCGARKAQRWAKGQMDAGSSTNNSPNISLEADGLSAFSRPSVLFACVLSLLFLRVWVCVCACMCIFSPGIDNIKDNFDPLYFFGVFIP